MAARLWFDDYPYLSSDEIQILSRTKKNNSKKGSRGKDESVVTLYSFNEPIEIILEVIERQKTCLGRFVLAMNDLDLDVDSLLKYYKGQQSVERGFSFWRINHSELLRCF